MLQPKQILRVLSQVITDKPLSTSSKGPLSVVLLSNKGLPLATANVPDLVDPDQLKIYSLWALNSLRQQDKSGNKDLDCWSVLELDENLRAMVKAFTTFEANDMREEMYAMLFYEADYDDALAKAQLDAVTDALSQGLAGYVPNRFLYAVMQ